MADMVWLAKKLGHPGILYPTDTLAKYGKEHLLLIGCTFDKWNFV